MIDRLNEESRKLAHSLSFGDSNTGNLFRSGDQTVAIDWATVTVDPTGVDAGCLVGSATIRSGNIETFLEAEKDLFSSYMAGLRSGGWAGEERHVRQAFFGQFGIYLMNVVSGWHRLLGESEEAEFWRDWVEKRFQTPFDQLPELAAPIIDSYPRYIEEISKLVGSS